MGGQGGRGKSICSYCIAFCLKPGEERCKRDEVVSAVPV